MGHLNEHYSFVRLPKTRHFPIARDTRKRAIYKILSSIFCLIFSFKIAQAGPTVVIVGGGPIGIISALIAAKSGAQVTVIEHRDSETSRREQVVNLNENTVKNLRELISEKRINQLIEDGHIVKEGSSWFMSISTIQDEVQKKAKENENINIKRGTFERVGEDGRILIKSEHHSEQHLDKPDLLIGADGPHSTTAKVAQIKTEAHSPHMKMYAICIVYKVSSEKNSLMELPTDYHASTKHFSTIALKLSEADYNKYKELLEKIGTPEEKEVAKKKILKTLLDALLKDKEYASYRESIESVQQMMPHAIHLVQTGFSKAENGGFKELPLSGSGTLPVYLIGDAYETFNFLTSAGLNSGVARTNKIGDLIKQIELKTSRVATKESALPPTSCAPEISPGAKRLHELRDILARIKDSEN